MKEQWLTCEHLVMYLEMYILLKNKQKKLNNQFYPICLLSFCLELVLAYKLTLYLLKKENKTIKILPLAPQLFL